MVTSYTVTGFTPVDAPLYTTPIQVTGHTVHNLTVARTPDGQAVFGWSSGGVYYCAINPDFEVVYQNDVVPDGDERVVFDNEVEGWSVNVGSLWVDRGELFCALSLSFTPPGVNIGFSKCFIADNVENPVVWTERGLIDYEAGTEAVIDINSAGPPLVLTTGVWVMPFATWGAHGGPGGIADRSSIVMSEDRGIDWTVRYSHRRAPGASGTTGPIADTIGQDPLTGDLWWSHYDGPVANQAFILRSQDSGASWVVIDANASQTWNFTIDDGVTHLYAAGAIGGVEWEYNDTDGDPGDEAGFIDMNLTIIPSNQTGTNFQSHVFLSHGSIAFVDENRISGFFFEPQGNCPIPDPLHIPYKDRLLKLKVDDQGRPDPKSYDLMAEHDFDNLKVIERWAANWMVDAKVMQGSPDSCDLFIPYKDHLRHAGPGASRLTPAAQRAISSMSFDNYKTIERWALRVTGGECACAGPSKCLLHIPFKEGVLGLQLRATEDKGGGDDGR